MMQTTASFTQQDGLFIDGHLHTFIEQQLCQQITLDCADVYQALATLVVSLAVNAVKTSILKTTV